MKNIKNQETIKSSKTSTSAFIILNSFPYDIVRDKFLSYNVDRYEKV